MITRHDFGIRMTRQIWEDLWHCLDQGFAQGFVIGNARTDGLEFDRGMPILDSKRLAAVELALTTLRRRGPS